MNHPARPRAEVLPLGQVHEVACAVAAANLGAVLGLPAKVVPGVAGLQAAHLPARGQYDAEVMVEMLGQDRPPGVVRVGVTNQDLCLPVFTFVFGQAMVGGGAAVASLHRLRGGDRAPAGRDLLYQRLAKVVCHEAAHALGLTHCHAPQCLMRFAGDLASLDAQPPLPCPGCRHRLARLLHGQAGSPT